jgi:hypothetical protein
MWPPAGWATTQGCPYSFDTAKRLKKLLPVIETVDLWISRIVEYSSCWPPHQNLSLLSTRRKRDAKGKSYLLFDFFRERMKDHRKEQV